MVLLPFVLDTTFHMVTFLALLLGLVLPMAPRTPHGSLTRWTSHRVTYEMSPLPPQPPLCSVAACLGAVTLGKQWCHDEIPSCHSIFAGIPGGPRCHFAARLRAVTHSQETLSQHMATPVTGFVMGTQLTCCLLGLAAFLYNRHRKKTTTLYLEAQWGGGAACDGISRTDHALQTHSHSAKGAFGQVPSGRLPSSARSEPACQSSTRNRKEARDGVIASVTVGGKSRGLGSRPEPEALRWLPATSSLLLHLSPFSCPDLTVLTGTCTERTSSQRSECWGVSEKTHRRCAAFVSWAAYRLL